MNGPAWQAAACLRTFRIAGSSAGVLSRSARPRLKVEVDVVAHTSRWPGRRSSPPSACRGWDDPYRAVHFALRVDTRDDTVIVEVQVLTLARDSVGLIDHAGVHDQAIPFLDWRHEQ